jgi:hypothetical protein
MAILFGSFGAKSLSSEGKLIHNIYGNPNSHRADKLFFLNLYKVYDLYILMDFYLVFLREFVRGPLNPEAPLKHGLFVYGRMVTTLPSEIYNEMRQNELAIGLVIGIGTHLSLIFN